MTTRISAEMPLAADGPGGEGSVTELPGFLHEPFAAAMSQSLLLPAFIALFGVVAALFLLGFAPAAPEPQRSDAADDYWDDDDYVDDDHYVEFTVMHDEPEPAAAAAPAPPVAPAAPVADVRAIEDEGDTEPMAARHRGHSPEGQGEHLLTPPADTWHDEPVEPTEPPAHRREPVRSLFDFLADVPPPSPSVEPIGFAHNGFHVDDEQRFQPLRRFEAREEPPAHAEPQKPDILSPDYPLDIGSHAQYESPDEAGFERPSRHELADDEPTSNGRHSRAEPDDASSRGRHYRQGD
jgi:hypothetical protein